MINEKGSHIEGRPLLWNSANYKVVLLKLERQNVIVTEMNCVVIRTSCFLQFALILKASIKAKDLVYKYQVENGVKIEKRTNK